MLNCFVFVTIVEAAEIATLKTESVRVLRFEILSVRVVCEW